MNTVTSPFIEAYLERIGFEGSRLPAFGTLVRLQKAHLLSIPFENLDIARGVPIELDYDKIFYKVVKCGRGGFCYELNGLFAKLLADLGFKVAYVAAEVYDREGEFWHRNFGHMALLVQTDKGIYLSDVGFGRFTFAPLEIRINKEQLDEFGEYVIRQLPDKSLMVNQIKYKTEVPFYRFSPAGRQLSEFEEMCHYHQTSPDSKFTQGDLCTIATSEDHRTTLTNRVLKTSENDVILYETPVRDSAHFDELLAKHFSIRL